MQKFMPKNLIQNKLTQNKLTQKIFIQNKLIKNKLVLNKAIFLIPTLLFCSKLIPVVGITIENQLKNKVWIRIPNQLPAEKQNFKNASIKNILDDESLKNLKSGEKSALNSYFTIIPAGKSETIKTESGQRLVEWKVDGTDTLYRTKKYTHPDKLSIYTKQIQGKDAYHYKMIESILGVKTSEPKEEFVNWVTSKTNSKPEITNQKKDTPETRQKDSSSNKTLSEKEEKELKTKYSDVYKAIEIIGESAYTPQKELLEKYRMYINFDGTKERLSIIKADNFSETIESANSKKKELQKTMSNISKLNEFTSKIELLIPKDIRDSQYKKFCQEREAIQKKLINDYKNKIEKEKSSKAKS